MKQDRIKAFNSILLWVPIIGFSVAWGVAAVLA
jgi:hypothetical protein